jgi:hypothetical protein
MPAAASARASPNPVGPDSYVAATGPGAFANRRDEVIGAVLDAERDAPEQVRCHYTPSRSSG